MRSAALLASAAAVEIAGLYLVWQTAHRRAGLPAGVAGVLLLGLYGLLVGLQREHPFGRAVPAYGGVFIIGALAWGSLAEGRRPSLAEATGAALCLLGAFVLIYASGPNT